MRLEYWCGKWCSRKNGGEKQGGDVWSLDPSKRVIERLQNELRSSEKAQIGFCQAMLFPEMGISTLL
jgi:hypothetical protein